jgi:hypothetical protein
MAAIDWVLGPEIRAEAEKREVSTLKQGSKTPLWKFSLAGDLGTS